MPKKGRDNLALLCEAYGGETSVGQCDEKSALWRIGRMIGGGNIASTHEPLGALLKERVSCRRRMGDIGWCRGR